MDKKKLIGAIIGVIAFGALIAGATFAWLTQNATIANGNYNNIGTMNFSVAYTKGTALTAVPILSSPTTNGANPAAHLDVKANKVSGSAPGNLTIYLNTENATSSALLTKGVLKYAVCVDACTSTDLTAVAASNKGTITATGKKALLTTPLTSSQTTYNVYFWLDSSLVDGTVSGAHYEGYISAEAVQTES